MIKLWSLNVLLALEVVWVVLWIIFAFISYSQIPDGNAESVADTQVLSGFVYACFHIISSIAVGEAREHFSHKEPLRYTLIWKLILILALEVFLTLGPFTRISAFVGPGFEVSSLTSLNLLRAISIVGVVLTGLSLIVVSWIYLTQRSDRKKGKKLVEWD
jgi:low temperature requirement protein LtrA